MHNMSQENKVCKYIESQLEYNANGWSSMVLSVREKSLIRVTKSHHSLQN